MQEVTNNAGFRIVSTSLASRRPPLARQQKGHAERTLTDRGLSEILTRVVITLRCAGRVTSRQKTSFILNVFIWHEEGAPVLSASSNSRVSDSREERKPRNRLHLTACWVGVNSAKRDDLNYSGALLSPIRWSGLGEKAENHTSVKITHLNLTCDASSNLYVV
eukprot:4542850-Pyramimonas_sp.AAC.1